MIENIRKRDGRLVPFEIDKIAGAIYKAFQACDKKYELKTALEVASIVEKNIKYSTENDYNINRFSRLLSNLNINHNIEIVR